MQTELDQFDNTTPSLTLEPELEAAPMPMVVKEETAVKVAEPVLTAEEQQMVDAFAAKIDVENTAQILQYGAGTQKKMADFSDAALANVRTQDLGEVGDLITSVVGELQGFDADEEKGFLGFFRKQANKLENMKNKYAKAEVNVEKISNALQQHQVRLLKDSALLDKMYEQNLAYFKELTMYILAGKQKLEEVRAGKLAGAHHYGDEHGKVIAGAFLLFVRRGEVESYFRIGKEKSAVDKRRADALLRFFYRRVRQTDYLKIGQAVLRVTFNCDNVTVDTRKSRAENF